MRGVRDAYAVLRQFDSGPAPILDKGAAEAAGEAAQILRSLADALAAEVSRGPWVTVAADAARRVAGRLEAHLRTN